MFSYLRDTTLATAAITVVIVIVIVITMTIVITIIIVVVILILDFEMYFFRYDLASDLPSREGLAVNIDVKQPLS